MAEDEHILALARIVNICNGWLLGQYDTIGYSNTEVFMLIRSIAEQPKGVSEAEVELDWQNVKT